MDLSTLLASFASAFTQTHRQLTLTLTLPDSTTLDQQLLPLSLHGEEGVSQLYRYELTCLSPDGAIELKTLLGQPVRIGIEGADGSETVRCGVVTQAKSQGSDGGFSRYLLVVEPPLALLTLRRTSRVFQDQTVPAIVQQILQEHQAANPVFARHQTLVLNLDSAPERSYCLQYRKSDDGIWAMS